jgi:aminopeptidase-like protein
MPESPDNREFTFRSLPWESLTEEADRLLRRLFPICRSLTGDGVRETLAILKEVAAFDVHGVLSGTVCYDWTVPEEWSIRDGYIATLSGERIVDFRESNLHVVSYSAPIDAVLSFEELEVHLHTLPTLPDAIPYRTTYYKRDWGFCLTHGQFLRLDRTAKYHVVIDSTLAPGSLTYGETLLPGRSGQEFLISTYCCHPSLANDNLSGMVLWSLLLRELRARPTRHSYRFVIVPETIGAIAYLHANEERMRQVAGGFVVTTVAGPGRFGYKHSFLGNHRLDRAVRQTFRELAIEPLDYPFDINGSDERQYSAPFFRIPIVTICKDKYYEYDCYHTSLDNLEFISASSLVETLKLYLLSIEKLECDGAYRSLSPHCEPMLGRRGLYPQTGGSIRQGAGQAETAHAQRGYDVSEGRIARGSELDAIRWLLFWGDGKTTLLEIAERTGLPVRQLYETAEMLRQHDLLERLPGEGDGEA